MHKTHNGINGKYLTVRLERNLITDLRYLKASWKLPSYSAVINKMVLQSKPEILKPLINKE